MYEPDRIWPIFNEFKPRVSQQALNIIQSRPFFDNTLTRQNLYSWQNKLYFIGNFRQSILPREQLNSFSFNEDLIATRYVHNSDKYEFDFCAVVKNNVIDIVSIGHAENMKNNKPNSEYDKLIVSKYQIENRTWHANSNFFFKTDSILYVSDQNITYDEETFYAIAIKKENDFHLCKLNDDGIDLLNHFQLDIGNRFINIRKILFDDFGNSFLVISENDKTKLVKIK